MDNSPQTSTYQDIARLFVTRCLRLFAFGFLSLVLLDYLSGLGWDDSQSGWLITCTQLGDTGLSFWIAIHADAWGRRKMLALGAVMMILAGLAFAISGNFWVLLIAATIGVLAPTASEVGPFLSIEQAMLTQLSTPHARTGLLAWYNLAGYTAAALGSLFAGLVVRYTQTFSSGADIYRPLVIGYAAVGVMMLFVFCGMRKTCEAPLSLVRRDWLGLHHSRGVVLKLSALFALDAFAGGFILQSFMAHWFRQYHHMPPLQLGAIFFVANMLSAVSALAAASIAARIGLINTMVFTHLPSNVLLLMVPFMPNRESALFLFLIRFSISQMDVPTRQSYTMAVVHPDERAAAAGITAVARSIGMSLSPVLAGYLLRSPDWNFLLFVFGGGIKIIYDLGLYWSFVTRKEAPDGDAV